MTVIYIDVLIGLNIYVTFLLLLTTESFLKTEGKSLRRAVSSLTGGILSLIILLPELNFILSLLFKLISAFIIVFINFGYVSQKLILQRVIIFFGVSNLFAGIMIAIWQIFTPPKLVIKNGVIYYHFSAVVLILSTIFAYAVSKILNIIFTRKTETANFFNAQISLNGKNTLLRVFLDTGNKAFSINGLPAVFCDAKKLCGVIPNDMLERIKNNDIPKSSMRFKVQMVPFKTITKSGVLMGIKPDSFILLESGKNVSCVVVPIFRKPDAEADAIAGEALLKTEVII